MRKVFVGVTAEFSREGFLLPRSFVWENGMKYEIDKVYECCKAASLKAGGQGLRYRCRVRGKEVHLFFEEGRWFVEA